MRNDGGKIRTQRRTPLMVSTSSSSSASSSSLSNATVRSCTSPSGIFARVAKASRTALFVLVSHTCTAPLLPATASRNATASSGAKFAEKTFPTPRSRLTTILGPESEGSMFQSLTVRSELPAPEGFAFLRAAGELARVEAVQDAVFRADVEVAVVVSRRGGRRTASHSFTVLSADAEAKRFWCCLFAASERTESTWTAVGYMQSTMSRSHNSMSGSIVPTAAKLPRSEAVLGFVLSHSTQRGTAGSMTSWWTTMLSVGMICNSSRSSSSDASPASGNLM
ncbi:hypothetical protein KC349_g24 [Hortaea werneckii]|nr:hypothetical protein KC349_g24 [Hortaea werneckii]